MKWVSNSIDYISLAGVTKGATTQKSKPMRAIHGLMSLPSSLKIGSSSKTSSKAIKFYNRDEPYYEFTNFYRAPVDIDGQHWPSTEHYFQAQKFVGTPYSEVIRGLSSAREAFQLSRDPAVSRWRRSDWDSVKDDVMLKALRCKFAQHPNLMKKLWETGDRELIEHTTNDSYWADGGGGGKGLNKLGKLLMKVRDEIVKVHGPYKAKKESNSSGSSLLSGRRTLRRSSSFSNLSDYSSRKAHSTTTPSSYQNSDSLASQPQVTSSGKIPQLRRSSSFATVTLASQPLATSSHKNSAYPSSKTTHQNPSPMYQYKYPSHFSSHESVSLRNSTQVQKSPKPSVSTTKSSSATKSTGSTSLSRSLYKRLEPTINPLTHKPWRY